MNITKKVVDDVNIVLSLEISKADYAEAVEKALKSYRQRAQMPGFRKGMVPLSLVKKMVGTQITYDEVNKLINSELYKYISENKVNVLGEPMLNNEQTPVDFMAEENFTVSFDIALAPEFDLKLDDSVKIPYYNIKVDDKMLQGQIDGYRRQFGEYVQVEEVAAEDVVKGNMAELDAEGNIVEGGIVAENTTVYPRYFKNEDEKAKFIGAKKFASVDFNPAVASDNSENELASMLQIDKGQAKNVKANFRFTITEITRHNEAEMNEEFFKKVFGDECTTEEAFKAKVSEIISAQLKENSEYKFAMDARETLKASVGDLTYPTEALKRWMLAKDEKRDAAKLDEDMPKILEDLKWQLIEEKIVSANGIQISDEDIRMEAFAAIRNQMMQYGMSNLPEEYLASYIESVMKDEKQKAHYRDMAVSRKIIAKIHEVVTLENKEVTMEEFSDLLK